MTRGMGDPRVQLLAEEEVKEVKEEGPAETLALFSFERSLKKSLNPAIRREAADIAAQDAEVRLVAGADLQEGLVEPGCHRLLRRQMKKT